MIEASLAPPHVYERPHVLLETRISELHTRIAAMAERYGVDPAELGADILALGLTDPSFQDRYRASKARFAYERKQGREEARPQEDSLSIGTCALTRAVNRFPVQTSAAEEAAETTEPPETCGAEVLQFRRREPESEPEQLRDANIR